MTHDGGATLDTVALELVCGPFQCYHRRKTFALRPANYKELGQMRAACSRPTAYNCRADDRAACDRARAAIAVAE